MRSQIGCAVVGGGRWGCLVAAELRKVAGLSLRGVADATPERALSAAESLETKAYTAATEAFADASVEAVVIAAPNDLHAALALEALRAGKHVLLEKPMALTALEAEGVDAAARERELVLMIDHIQRYYALLAELKQLVETGVIGTPQAAAVSRRDFLKRTTAWLQQRRHVGGLLYQSGCHEFDFLCWTFGEAIEISSLASPQVVAPELDYPDMIVSQIRFASGVVAQVWSCMTDPLMGYDGVVTGSEGSATFDLYHGRLRWRRLDGQEHERRWDPPDRWAPWAWIESGGIADGESEALRALLADFRDAVCGLTPPPVGGEDGLRAVELAQGGYLSIVEGRPVTLPLSVAERDRRAYLESGYVEVGFER
jgi:predicted dehydrogenase